MITLSPKLIERFRTYGVDAPLIENWMEQNGIDNKALFLELLQTQGLSLKEAGGKFFFKTANTPLHQEVFTIFDIECNGSHPSRDQIIEIGAIKYQNGTELGRFESLVHATHLPHNISELTGITLEALSSAPTLSEVMHDFRNFIGDSVLVAHALKFDYDFLSAMMVRVGLGKLLNRALCTIDLAERTLSSAKYGLKYLNHTLMLQEDFIAHRAFHDATITTKLFEYLLTLLDENITTTEELIRFSKEAKRVPRAPLVQWEEESLTTL